MADASSSSRRTECLFEKSSTRCAVSFFSECLRRPRPGRCSTCAGPRTSRSAAPCSCPALSLPAGTYIFEVLNPEQRLRYRQGAEPGSEDRCILMQFTRAVYRPSSGQSRCDHFTRGNTCRQPSTSESVVSAIRDARPRVHLLAVHLHPPAMQDRHKSCTADCIICCSSSPCVSARRLTAESGESCAARASWSPRTKCLASTVTSCRAGERSARVSEPRARLSASG